MFVNKAVIETEDLRKMKERKKKLLFTYGNTDNDMNDFFLLGLSNTLFACSEIIEIKNFNRLTLTFHSTSIYFSFFYTLIKLTQSTFSQNNN